MSDEQQFTLTAPDGTVIAQGSMSALTERVLDSKSRKEAEELLRDAAVAIGQLEQLEEREQSARVGDIRRLCAAADELGKRLDAYEAKRKEQARRDAEEEAKQIQSMLDSLPDPDDPHAYFPSGDLHTLPAKDSDPEGIIPTPQDPTGTVLEDEGPPVPLSYGTGVPLTYVKGVDEGSPVPGEPLPPRDKPSRKEIKKLGEPKGPDERPPVGISW
jgi:hypothetical protein